MSARQLATISCGMSKPLKPNKKIWVTQSWPRGKDSAADFETLGLTAISSPLLDIVPSSDETESPSRDTHLIFTARNGVRAFADIHSERDYSVTCVGDATAELAQEKGFKDVKSVSGEAIDVIEYILKSYLKTQTIRHCAGRHVRGRIVETLKDAGYNAERIEYYASSPVTKLPINIESFDYVALYSPLGAETFASLTKTMDVSTLTSLCISQATEEALDGTKLVRRLIAKTPDQAAMMAELQLDLTGG